MQSYYTLNAKILTSKQNKIKPNAIINSAMIMMVITIMNSVVLPKVFEFTENGPESTSSCAQRMTKAELSARPYRCTSML